MAVAGTFVFRKHILFHIVLKLQFSVDPSTTGKFKKKMMIVNGIVNEIVWGFPLTKINEKQWRVLSKITLHIDQTTRTCSRILVYTLCKKKDMIANCRKTVLCKLPKINISFTESPSSGSLLTQQSPTGSWVAQWYNVGLKTGGYWVRVSLDPVDFR